MLKRFIRPMLDMVQRAVVEFLKYWRRAPWPTQVAMFPIAILAICYLGLYTFLFGCSH